MFYATRTAQIAHNVSETQLLSFYTKRQRDEYVTFEGGEAITARQKKDLMPVGVGRTIAGKGGVFFAVPVMADEPEGGRNELAADTISGVYVCENAAANNGGEGRAVLHDGDFYEALSAVRDGETIYGNVSDDWAAKIEAEYGIR